MNNNAPLKTLPVKEKKRRLKPWITPCILASIKTKKSYYKKFMKTKAKFWYNRYKYYRDINTFKKTIMTLKKHGKKLLKATQKFGPKKI